MLNKSKWEKIVPLFLLVLFMTTYTHFTPSVHADSDDKSQITQLETKKNISIMKTWTIKFKTPVDENSLFINVKDSQGNFMNVKISTDNSGEYVYINPPEEGYKLGQTYYLNISKDIVFKDPSRSLKNNIQMKLTTNDIEIINIDEATSVITTNNTFAFNLMKNLISEDANTLVKNLISEDANTLVKINKWVNNHTEGQIKKILDSIDKDTGAILINSLCFKGKWEDQFLTSNTKKEDFTLSNSNKLNIATMQNTSYVNYLEGFNFRAISLPYYDNMEMDIFLPKEIVNINDFTKSITKEKFHMWINNFKNTYVLQQIPKFKMYYDVDLNDTLKALRMNKAFNSREVDFTKLTTNTITSQDLYINEIKHKAYIKANRPFFFIIRDTKTGGIFMGKMDNPNASYTEPTKPIK